MNDHTTGQIFIRNFDKTKDGRRLIGLVGLIGVSPDCILKGEHQYVIVGTKDGIMFHFADEGKDITKEARGLSFDGLITSPIWRV